jgi:hypothetical protein
MRRIAIIVGLALCCSAGCKKGDDKGKGTAGTGATGSGASATGTDPAVPDPSGTPAPAGDPVAAVGVEAGGLERDADEGEAAVVTAVEGTVEVRRVGETEWAAAKAETELFPGDQVRTGEQSAATITVADESVIEVAEVSTVAIATRDASADPASGAAVLAGLARFTVAARAPGEGAFRVYTPGGVVMTRGTTYGVGVAASGETRIGVESGAIDVIGIAALDAEPIVVDGGNAVIIAPAGTVAAPVAWPEDDWGVWRDTTDATITAEAAVDAHGAALADLDGQITATYADLDTTADGVATFEATAATSADANDVAAYEASLPEGTAMIDASFGLAGRLELLTWAYASRAALASEIYIRHPEVETHWTVVAPRVDAAVLWPKRYELTAVGYLEPLRVQYYVHHPRGRVHAELVGVTVPAFYASVEPVEIEPVVIRKRIKTRIWIAPTVAYRASTRPVWIAAPAKGWRKGVKVVVAPPRGRVTWYVRPPQVKAKLFIGAPVKGKYVAKIKIKPREPRANLRAKWKRPVGVKIKVGAPDLTIAAGARSRVKLDGKGRVVVKAKGGVKGPGAVVIKGGDAAGAVVVKGKQGGAVVVKGGGDAAGAVVVKGKKAGDAVKIKAGGGAGGKAGGGAKVKVKTPGVKVKVKGGAKVDLGGGKR